MSTKVDLLTSAEVCALLSAILALVRFRHVPAVCCWNCGVCVCGATCLRGNLTAERKRYRRESFRCTFCPFVQFCSDDGRRKWWERGPSAQPCVTVLQWWATGMEVDLFIAFNITSWRFCKVPFITLLHDKWDCETVQILLLHKVKNSLEGAEAVKQRYILQ